MLTLLKPAILIVSDTAAVHGGSDHTGPVLSRLFASIKSSSGGRIWDEPVIAVVPDLVSRIQVQIKNWTEKIGNERIDLIVTSGGTGFSIRDRTPECVKAVGPLLHKQAPGLVHAMLASSLEVTPFAMMSRPVAGIRAKSVIVTVPGSTKGAKENLEAIIKCLPHACWQAKGENSRQAHAGGVQKLEVDVDIIHPTEPSHSLRTPASTNDLTPEKSILLQPSNSFEKTLSSAVEGGLIRERIGTFTEYHKGHHSGSLSNPHPESPDSHRPSLSATLRRPSLASDQNIAQNLKSELASPIISGCGRDHGHHNPTPKRRTCVPQRQRSNDPKAGPIGRSRQSPYPMLTVDQALELISFDTPQPRVIELPVDLNLVGYVLARDVYAAASVPAYRASIVDGYAIVASHYPGDGIPSTKGEYPVVSISHAEPETMMPKLKPGEVARVTTGAPIPDGATAVVMVEDTALVSITADGNEEAIISVLSDEIQYGENIREPGSDVEQGSLILEQHDVITSHGGEIGLLASTGVRSVEVYAKPTVGVLSTGDELIEHDNPLLYLKNAQVRDSNRPSLLSALRAQGYPVIDLGIARDTPAHQLEECLRNALRGTPGTPEIDVIVTTGSVSMGELDLLKPTVEHRLGGTIHFGRVAMKPGKPTTFATIPFKSSASNTRETRLLFGLPGNPASALVTLNIFVLPCLQQMSGGPPPYGLPRVLTRLEEQIMPDPKRREYHRAQIHAGRDGTLRATSTGGQRSSKVGSLKGANGLLMIEPGEAALRKGDTVEALLMGNVIGY
ncbi:hypothetical protein KEM54_006898 [Ascosphaera aggregata]|nr:hypothetical protein KEM54_006898 [Ascosphaera aggregata]